ncbi:hypothetical protein M1L60_07465 [Actinoplanes sp. TRM 88003]|uniref:Uncharacterized protein n=1 Tax=Paractinoplanes aksuensis TaxID=2939490 RepID=A0ABT1DHZ1_9ACTN|nr:hypothetical protein [Actinoplanes aksuensis]MCO8270432.1 hypothetical protein [Actinoplanes aksuensis]
MSEMYSWRSRPPYSVVVACVLIGVGCVLLFVRLVLDGGNDKVSGAEWVIGSLIICAAVGASFIIKILRQSRRIAYLAMILAGSQVLLAPAEWSYDHSVSAGSVVGAVTGGAITVLLALPRSRAWLKPVD